MPISSIMPRRHETTPDRSSHEPCTRRPQLDCGGFVPYDNAPIIAATMATTAIASINIANPVAIQPASVREASGTARMLTGARCSMPLPDTIFT